MAKTSLNNQISTTDRRLLLLGVFLLTFSLLALEVAFTRLFSVMLAYHYLFLVLSLAMLGLGLGAVGVRLFSSRFPNTNDNGFVRLSWFAGLFSLTVVFPVLAAMIFPANLYLLLGLLFLPFFFAGMFLAEVFRAVPSLSSRIYGADLTGAGAGAAGVVLGLNTLGGPGTILVLGIVIALVSLLFMLRRPFVKLRMIWLPVVSIAAAALLLWVNFSSSGLATTSFNGSSDKEIQRALNPGSSGGEIIETRWSAFGRTDLVSFPNDPSLMVMFIDGTSGTAMYRFNGDVYNPSPKIERLKYLPGYLPLQFLKEGERDNALIIGPGGGMDVLLTLMAKVKNITAVEVNGDFVDIVRDYSAYNGGIYTDFDNVSVRVGEGRNFLKRQTDKYDIIMMTMPVTKTSRSLEGYALTENFLFTTDSISDYLEHLTDEGRLIIVAHDSLEILRLVSISLAALEQSGMDNQTAMERILTLGSDALPVFVLKKTPFEAADTISLHKWLHELGVDVSASYLPNISPEEVPFHVAAGRFAECSMLDPLLMGIGAGAIKFNDLELGHGDHPLDVSPVNDDSPFFYDFEKGLPENIPLVLWVSGSMLLLVVLGSLLPKQRTAPPGGNRRMLQPAVFFLFLGTGFMLAEISLFQRINLFLGGPILSMAVSLSALLLGAGLGSLYSGRFSREHFTRLITAGSLVVTLVLTVYAFTMLPLFSSLLGAALPVRLLTTVTLLALPGFFMGFLFPTGLRLLKNMDRGDFIPWAWGINGIASVFGSVSAVAIAISYGYTYALLTGAGLYFLLFLLSHRDWQAEKKKPVDHTHHEIRAET